MTVATFHFAAQASRLKYAIAPSGSVVATGDSTIGIDGSVWTIVGAAGSETSDWVLSAQTAHACTVTAPSGTNKACILQRLVSTTSNGRSTQIATTAKIYSGTETICPNETDESDQDAGWAPLVNAGLIAGGTGGGLPEAGDWTGAPLTLADNRYYTATANADGRIVLAIAPSGHVIGAQALVYVAADTLADTANLVLAADLNIANSAGFDPTLATWITITRLANGFLGSLDPRPALDVALPTVVSATVEAATPTKLDVVYAERAIVRTPAGITLSSPARTLTLDSGNGTTTHRYTISGAAFVGGEAGNFVCAAGSLQDMNGNLCGALSQAYVNNAGVYVLPRGIGRWRANDVSQGGGVIISWTDLTGNGNTMTQGTAGSRAAYIASDAAFGGRACGNFDGSDDFYQNLDLKLSGVDPTDLNAWTVLVVAKFDAVSGQTPFSAWPDSPGSAFDGVNIFAEGSNMKLSGKDSGGIARVAFSDTTAAHSFEGRVTQATRTIYIDNALQTDLGVAWNTADDTPALLGAFMGRLSAALYYFDGKIAEVALSHGSFSAPERAAWDAYVASYYGL